MSDVCAIARMWKLQFSPCSAAQHIARCHARIGVLSYLKA